MTNLKTEKYYKCSKCGAVCHGLNDFDAKGTGCTASAPWRTSGICGGSFTIPINKAEYDLYIIKN